MAPYDGASQQMDTATASPSAAPDCEAREAALQAFAAELTRANRDLEQFAYVAAHDLQEPLRLMLSFTELFARRYHGLVDDTGQQYLHYALSGARQMKALITDLLEYTRVCNDLAPFTPTALDELAGVVKSTLQAALEDCGGRIEWEPLPHLHAHRQQLQQLLYILARNSICYRAPNTAPHIQLSAVRLPSAWQLGVHDNGPGIPTEYCERVFMIFQRLTRDRAQPGTGMGLAMAKKIVELHGGQIWIEPGTDAGTSVLFTIPDATAARLRAPAIK